MRLLHERHGDGRDGAVEIDAAPDRGSNQDQSGRPSLPVRNSHAHRECDHASGEGVKQTIMDTRSPSRRAFLKSSSALVVSFAIGGILNKTVRAQGGPPGGGPGAAPA